MPIIPIIIKVTDAILSQSVESLKKKIPIRNVPTAPIPVQTAYAVPIGIVFCAVQRKKPLSAIEIQARMIHIALKLEFCDSLKPKGQPISKIPAMSK